MPIAGAGGSNVGGAQITDDSISNADINSAAGIAMTKIALTTKVINATRLLSGSSGAVTYAHGLGRAPKLVKLDAYASFSASNHASSSGAYDGTSNMCSYKLSNDDATASAQSSTQGVHIEAASGNGQTGVITVDATNITITWTKIGSGTETIYMTMIVI